MQKKVYSNTNILSNDNCVRIFLNNIKQIQSKTLDNNKPYECCKFQDQLEHIIPLHSKLIVFVIKIRVCFGIDINSINTTLWWWFKRGKGYMLKQVNAVVGIAASSSCRDRTH